MKIAIIGTGQVGISLAKGWAKAGHEIYLGLKKLNTQKLQTVLNLNERIVVRLIPDAVIESNIIVMAMPPESVKEISELVGEIRDKVVIDTINSIMNYPEPYYSTAEAIKAWTGCERIIKCFNTTGVENLSNPLYDNSKIDTFMAGDNEDDKMIVKQLAYDLGFEECYDCGGFDKIPLLESMALFWMNLAFMQGYGPDIGLKVLQRGFPR
ncbi:MAG: NAD(P)-binding domain-containing protein [Leptospiraceae bacterium]|nr:NAD(P)-binding domain-containing protein [Leptospiraceae bacterium]MCP5495723.1 NAD(P)-binding domain-containing protein [Leptospiraceae bacterium]